MKKLLATNNNNWSALIARLALGITLFPHGAQKLLGWFGGYGYQGTMGFLTGQAGLSYPIALLVILIESVAALMVIAGSKIFCFCFCFKIEGLKITCYRCDHQVFYFKLNF
jgi:putative oxidoreductase